MCVFLFYMLDLGVCTSRIVGDVRNKQGVTLVTLGPPGARMTRAARALLAHYPRRLSALSYASALDARTARDRTRVMGCARPRWSTAGLQSANNDVQPHRGRTDRRPNPERRSGAQEAKTTSQAADARTAPPRSTAGQLVEAGEGGGRCDNRHLRNVSSRLAQERLPQYAPVAATRTVFFLLALHELIPDASRSGQKLRPLR